MRALAICTTPGCGEPTVRGRCPDCESDYRRQHRRRTPEEHALPKHWRAIRARYLRKHPHCECDECLALPKDQRPTATDVHHVVGRELGGRSTDDNLEALAHGHHSRRTARQQPGGFGAFAKRDRIIAGRV